MMRRILLVAIFLAFSGSVAQAVLPDEVLKDPALEARARTLSKGIRCLVCQNQSIDESNADLARDLRILVRKRLTLGDSNQQVLDFLVARYGDFILLKPPFRLSTYALWLGPLAVLVFAIGGIAVYFRRRRALRDRTDPLTGEEEARLARLLDGDESRV